MSTSQSAVMLFDRAVKAGIVCVWVAGKTVIPSLTGAISECFRDEVLSNKALYKSTLLYFLLYSHNYVTVNISSEILKNGLTEIWMFHCLSCCQAFLVIVLQKFIKKVDSFGADEMLVLTVDEPLPALPRMPTTAHHVSVKTTQYNIKTALVTYILST